MYKIIYKQVGRKEMSVSSKTMKKIEEIKSKIYNSALPTTFFKIFDGKILIQKYSGDPPK